MNARRPLLGLGVAATTIVVFAILDAAGSGPMVSILVAAVMAGVASALAARPVTPVHDVIPASSTPPSSIPIPPSPAPDAGGLDAAGLSKLRHDLRGILSPALLTADRLLASTEDPTARRSAELVITTVERANARLSAVSGTAAAVPPAPLG